MLEVFLRQSHCSLMGELPQNKTKKQYSEVQPLFHLSSYFYSFSSAIVTGL